MARVHNFSAGPAALPTSVLAEIADEMMDYRGCGMSVLEMSHRSSMYQQIIDDAEATLRRLMSIPDNYRVLFLQGGATVSSARDEHAHHPKVRPAGKGEWRVRALSGEAAKPAGPRL